MTLANNRAREAEASGFVLVAILATLLPLMIIAGAASTFLVGSSRGVQNNIAGTRAFLAAESGIDETIYRMNVGTLSGNFVLNMGEGMVSTITITDLGTDLVDNDGDAQTDEADEDVLRVRSVGVYRGVTCTVVAYLGTLAGFATVDSPVMLMGTPLSVILFGASSVSGTDVNMDGSPGSPIFDLPGIAVPAAQSAALLAEIDAGEALVITGTGGSPSVGSTALDVLPLFSSYKQAATNIISKVVNNNVTWGNASTSDFQISYAGHNIVIKGTSVGSGVLVVDGTLKVEGTFRFDGVILVTDFAHLTGDCTIFGALVVGFGGKFKMHNNAVVQYSKQALDIVGGLGGGAMMFNGWQKISNN